VLTLGQYLRPSPAHLAVEEYVTPEVLLKAFVCMYLSLCVREYVCVSVCVCGTDPEEMAEASLHCVAVENYGILCGTCKKKYCMDTISSKTGSENTFEQKLLF